MNQLAEKDPQLPPLPYGEDSGAPHAAALTRPFARPLFLPRSPARIKPFSTQPDPTHPDLLLNHQLTAPHAPQTTNGAP
ncbi:hypothetical protein CSW34_06710, partial [Thermus scotoductus]